MKAQFFTYSHGTSFGKLSLCDRVRIYYLYIILLMALPLAVGCQPAPGFTKRISAVSADKVTNQLVTITVDTNFFQTNPINGKKSYPLQLQYFDPASQQYTWIATLNGSNPRDLAVDAENHRAYLISSWSGVETLSEIDLSSGIESIVSNFYHGEGVAFGYLQDLIYDPVSNIVFVANEAEIIAVEPITGYRILIARLSELDPKLSKLAFDSLEQRIFAAYNNGVLMFDLKTGERTVLADSSKNIGIGDILNGISNIVYYAEGQKLLITDDHQVIELDPLNRSSRQLLGIKAVSPFSGWSDSTTILNEKLIVLLVLDGRGVRDELISDYLYAYDFTTLSYYPLEEQRESVAKMYLKAEEILTPLLQYMGTMYVCSIDVFPFTCPLP